MIGAVVMAAGLSTRMGSPKMLLPWGTTTVIGQVVQELEAGSVDQIVVVAGGLRREIKQALRATTAVVVYNPDFANGEMLPSFQVGLRALHGAVNASLVVLGDQPQIERQVVQQIADAYHAAAAEDRVPLMIPSFQMRRGHPWLVSRALWPEILELAPPETLRDFLHRHTDEIAYVNVDTRTIFQDLDTEADYRRFRPDVDV